MIKLQNILAGLPQSGLVKGLLDRVDREMQHIERNMPQHLVGHESETLDLLRTTLAPSDSMSVVIRGELERLGTLQASKTENAMQWAREWERRESSPGLSEKSGSDINPPPVVMLHSIRKVDAWVDGNINAKPDAGWLENDNVSLVSMTNRIVGHRPEIEDELIWGPTGHQRKRQSKGSTRSHSSLDNVRVDDKFPYKVPVTQISNCVYKKPPFRLNLKNIRRQVGLLWNSKGKGDLKSDIEFKYRSRNVKRLSKRHNISLKEAVKLSLTKRLQKESAYMMSGGRSPPESIRRLMESPGGGYHARSNLEGNYVDCKPEDQGYHDLLLQLHDSEDVIYSDDSYTTSSISSRSSTTYLVNLMNVPQSSLYEQQQGVSSHTSWTKSSGQKESRSPPTSVAQGPVVIGRAQSLAPVQNLKYQKRPHLTAEAPCEGHSYTQSSYQSTASRTKPNINKPLPPLPLRAMLRPDSDGEALCDVSLEKKTELKDRDVSDAVQASRRRRGTQTESGASILDNYRKEERERIWGAQKS
jgi:hypothetical protein